jgi:hypothetical protein
MKKEYRSFADARKFTRSLKIQSNKEWRLFTKSKDFPSNIPASPDHIYKKQWTNWGDWLDNGLIATDKKQFLSFQDARNIVHYKKLKNTKQWRLFTKSKDFPSNIPSSPAKVYKNKGWVNVGDWLGTGTIAVFNKSFLPFNEAREFVKKLKIKNSGGWDSYCKSGNKPQNIPSSPSYSYKKEYLGIKDWLGTGQRIVYREYTDAKKFVKKLDLKSYKEWKEYCKSGNKPDNIPANPSTVYKKEWTGYGDWLGTGTVASFNREYKTFEDARKFVQELNLKNQIEWIKYIKSGNKPEDIPAGPNTVYKKEWRGSKDWLGTGQRIVYREYTDAKKFVKKLDLKSYKEWKEYCKSGNKPQNIPAKPNDVYKNKGWKGVGDWLGTGTIAPQDRVYKTFEDAKKFVQELKIIGTKEWRELTKTKDFPKDIPKSPERVYIKQWTTWGEWLGTGTISPSKMQWRSYRDAIIFVQSLNLKASDEWYDYCNSDKKPKDIPSNPHIAYKKEWKSMGEWLGTGTIASQVKAKQWLPFNEAKIVMQKLAKKYNLKNSTDWRKFAKSGNKPDNVPSSPWDVYSKKRKKK